MFMVHNPKGNKMSQPLIAFSLTKQSVLFFVEATINISYIAF